MGFEQWLISIVGEDRTKVILKDKTQTEYYQHFYDTLIKTGVVETGEVSQSQQDALNRVDAHQEYLVSIGAQTRAGADDIHDQVIDKLELGTSPTGIPAYTQAQSWAKTTNEKVIREYSTQAQRYQQYLAEDVPDYLNRRDQWQAQTDQQITNLKGREKAQMLNNRAAAKRQEKQFKWEEDKRAREKELQIASGKIAQDTARDREIYEMAHPEIPKMEQTESQVLYPFLEKLPEHIKRYYEPRMGSLIQEFESQYGRDARTKWWEKQHTPVLEPSEDVGSPSDAFSSLAGQFNISNAAALETLGRYESRFETGGDPGEFANLTPEEIAAFSTAQGSYYVSPSYAKPQKTTDPFEQFASQYPFLEEFYQKPARERGSYPTKFVGKTRWLTGY